MALADPIRCKTCGNLFVRTGKNHKFCNPECRQAPESIYDRWQTCKQCGTEFNGRKRMYCSDACCDTARYERDRIKRTTPEYKKRMREKWRREKGDPVIRARRAKSDKRYNTDPRVRARKAALAKEYRRARGRADRRDEYIVAMQKRGSHVCWLEDKGSYTGRRCANPQWQRNAREAWNYWIKTKAPDWWLDEYYKTNPWLDHRLTKTEKYRLKYRLNPDFQISERIRRQIQKARKRDGIANTIRSAIKGGTKSPTVERLFGYSISQLKAHIEKQFTGKMSWPAFMRGDIHIDHIVPQSAFNLLDESEYKSCWSLSNLQPLWKKHNLKKGGKIIYII